MNYFIGQSASFSKTISECDIYQFAGITGDLNPIHVDEEFAKQTKFKRRIAHGMLTSSFICTVLGTKLPGEGTIHIKQELNFIKPVFIGDTINVKLTINKILDKGHLEILCEIFNQSKDLVVFGTSTVKPPQDEI